MINFKKQKIFADIKVGWEDRLVCRQNILSRVKTHYTRAACLSAAALALQDEHLIRMGFTKMLHRWAEYINPMAWKPRQLN